MVEFNNLEELKKRIEPALLLKAKELDIDEDTIFKYLSQNKWKNANNLHLFEIVDDIINYKKEEMSDKDEAE